MVVEAKDIFPVSYGLMVEADFVVHEQRQITNLD